MMVYLTVLAGLFGAAIGSFLNVCIYRIPAEESIIRPASRCPQCGSPIRWHDNIPIIGWLALRGKCRDCGKDIPARYAVVEALTALVAIALFLKFGPTMKFISAFAFSAVLIVITFIDLDHQIIPDVISLPGIPIFFLAAVFFMGLSWTDSLIGVLIGGGVLYLIAFFYYLFTRREGMGGGDIKLLAMMGAFLGWKSLLFILLVSSFLGAIAGIGLMAFKGADMKYAVPFGPFLAIAAFAYIFYGQILNSLLLMW
jgi:leader peptidase (prepilin peptidase)/N-methyltransferase